MAQTDDSQKIAKHLNNVIELDYDAISAYQAAIDRLENAQYKSKLEEFKQDHQRHVEALGKLVQAHGEEPASSGDIKKVLTKGQVVIAGLAGDAAILEAMKLNEDQTNRMYEKEVEEAFPQDIHKALEQGLADERRHRSWINQTLDSLS